MLARGRDGCACLSGEGSAYRTRRSGAGLLFVERPTSALKGVYLGQSGTLVLPASSHRRDRLVGSHRGARGTHCKYRHRIFRQFFVGTESTKALSLLTSAFPAQAGDGDTIVFHVNSGSVKDPAVQSNVSSMLAQVAKSSSVAAVASPYAAAGAAQLSKDGRTAYANVHFARLAQELPKADVQHVIDLAQSARSAGLDVELGGNAIKQIEQTPPSNSTLIGLVAAGIILFIAFGSLFAMALPLLTAVVALGSGLLAVGLLSHIVSIGTVGPTLAALIGLGVGCDYALVRVTSHRPGFRADPSPPDPRVPAPDPPAGSATPATPRTRADGRLLGAGLGAQTRAPRPKGPHLVLKIENALAASQADTLILGGALHLSQPGDVARRVATPTTASSRRRDQTQPVVLPQGLRVHAGELCGNRDDENRGLVIG